MSLLHSIAALYRYLSDVRFYRRLGYSPEKARELARNTI